MVVHGDRKTQRALTRALGASLVPVRAAATAAEAGLLIDGDAGTVIVTSALLCDAPALVALGIDASRARGARTVVLSDVPRAAALSLFTGHQVGHLVQVGAGPASLAEELLLTVQKLLRRDLFGLEKYLGWSATVRETEVVSTMDRMRALDELRVSFERMGAPVRAARQAALIADELLSNAAHNAPVDSSGVAYLREHARDVDRRLTGRERPRLRWGADGRQLAVEVTDHYGALSVAEIRRHIGKLLTRTSAIRHDTSGAGLGIAMAYDSSSQLVFNLDHGRRCQVIGLVDQLARDEQGSAPVPSLHIFETRPDE